nr:hypothetical protein [Tanacetum cinerariifolium]
MWKAIERLKQGESINVQDLETNLYWEFGKFTSRDGKSLKSYYSRSQQAATRNRGKAIVSSPTPIYDQELSMVAEDDEMSKDREIDKLMVLISLSFKKIYKPTNNNLRTLSNTSRANHDNSPRISRGIGYDNQRLGNVVGARETVGTTVVQKSGIQCYNCKEFRHVARECMKPKRAKDVAYHREKMLLCKQEEARIQLNAEQADWRDDTDDESEDQELEAHYIDHPEKSESVNDTYPIEQDEHNVIIDSLDMCYDREQIDQNDDDDDLANERELFASLIEKLKCEIDDSKSRNKFLETSNKILFPSWSLMKCRYRYVVSSLMDTAYWMSEHKMTTLAEHIIVAGAENRPPMLEMSMYGSWASHIRLFIKWKKNGRMMLDSVDNGPLVYPTVEENGQTRPKKYFKLTKAQ